MIGTVRNWHQDIHLVLSTTQAGDVLSHISQRFISTKKTGKQYLKFKQYSKFIFYSLQALYVRILKKAIRRDYFNYH